jgi:hypothetical protein
MLMSLNWTTNPVRFFQHLLRETDAIGLDPKQLIDEVKMVGAGATIVMGGGFSAWYPTNLSSQTVNPHLDRDFLGEVIAAAKAADVRVLVRMDISKGRSGMQEKHPDWFVRGEDGSVGTLWDMPQICSTGPFWQVETFKILEEIIDRYGPDGFFFNYLHVPRCHCHRCREIVMAATGTDVPTGLQRSPAYERWRQAYLATSMRRVRDFIGQRNPDAILVPYHHVHDGWDIRQMAAISGMIGSQVSNPVVPNPVDPQPIWNHWAAEEALTARALKADSAPILIQTTSEFFASRQTAMPTGRLIHNMVQAAAHGANTAPAANGFLMQDDPRFVPALKLFAAYQIRNARWYEGLQSMARVAIVKSEDSRSWGLDAGKPAGSPDGNGHVGEFRGFYEMLTDMRYSCDVIIAGGLAAEAMAAYDLIVLPAVSCLSAADAAQIDTYVANGGTIVASADFAIADEMGNMRLSGALSCLPGHPGISRSAVGAYFELVKPAYRTAFGNIPHIAASGDFWSPFHGQSERADDLALIGPFANNAPEFTTVVGPGGDVGVIDRTYGCGRAIWFPWRIGALYHRYGVPEYRTLMGMVCNETLGAPEIETDAPAAVEFIVYSHPEGTVLHVLNGAAPQTKGMVECTPLAGFTVRIKTDATRATLLNTGDVIPSKRDGALLTLHLARLDTFAAIALTEAPSGFAKV